MAHNLEIELQQIGLNEREAKVYLASLELGPNPVQKIAQRSGIPRATVYLILDDLQSKGFVTIYNEGKKTFFVAESPERLSVLVEKREQEVEQQKEAVEQLIPQLIRRAQRGKSDNKTSVRFYEGIDSMKASLRDDFKNTGKEILNIFDRDKVEDILKRIDLDYGKVTEKRKRAKIKRRIIYTTQDDKPYDYPKSEAVHVLKKDLPLTADITIIGDSVSITPYNDPIRGIAIEDPAIAEAMKNVFNLLWSKYQ